MKKKIKSLHSFVLTILIVIACFTWSWPSRSSAQVESAPLALVQAVQGTVEMTAAGSQKPLKLLHGDMVNIWETITTNAGGKLFLKWETGMLTSLGGSSSVSVDRRESAGGPVNVLEMTAGVLRVTKRSGGGNVTPYIVTIPEASIEPLDYNAPVDFIVEVQSPTMSVIRVITGPVRINNKSLTQPGETAVSGCHTVFVTQGAQEPRVFGSDSVDVVKLVNRTTIPVTVMADLACSVPTRLF
jgi:hypothetical protein